MGCAAYSSRTWLSEISLIFDALQTCPTMVRCARAAYKSSAGQPNRAVFIEADVLRRLSSRANTETLSRELLSKSVELVDLPTVISVRVEVVKRERYPLDCWFVFQHDSSETRIPVNVKTETKTERKNRGCALAPFLNWLTATDAKLDMISRNLDADQIILDLIHGKKKILPGRDYQLFTINLTSGEVSFRSLFARHQPNGKGLAIARHMSRDVTNYLACGAVIGADFDIARELGLALLPKASQSRLETQHLANALATKNHPE